MMGLWMCYSLSWMLSTVDGTLMEARASETLGNCQRKKTPSQTMRDLFFFWSGCVVSFFGDVSTFHPTILKKLYTLLHYCIIRCLKKPSKTHKNIQHAKQKDETMVGSILMSTDKYIQIQYVIYTCMYVWRVHLPRGPELGFPSFRDAFQWKQRHMTYKNASNHRGENGALGFLGGM